MTVSGLRLLTAEATTPFLKEIESRLEEKAKFGYGKFELKIRSADLTYDELVRINSILTARGFDVSEHTNTNDNTISLVIKWV